MPKCTVCHHPEHLAIEQALLSEEYTLAALSRKFGPSPSALQRHKGHLRDKMRESHRRLQEIQEQGSLFLLNAFLEHVKKGVETAEAEGNLTGVFRGSYIGSRIIHQLNRMEGSMSLETLHRLLTSPAWVPQGSLLPTDPKLITELHQALVDGACLPCPEPAPLISDDDDEEDEDAADDAEETAGHDAADPLLDNSKLVSAFSETENGKRNTENGFSIRQLRELFPDLDMTLADLPPRPENAPENQRKITEKSAKNTPGLTKNGQQNHKDTPCEKKLPKNPSVGRDPQGGGSPNEVHPAVPVADASSAIVAGDSAPALSAMINESEIPSPQTENELLPNPRPLVPDPCPLKTDDPDMFITGNKRPASFPLGAAPAPPVSEEPPDLYNRTGDELFLMTHGYPRNNPPKHIPNRRLNEDIGGLAFSGKSKNTSDLRLIFIHSLFLIF